MPLGHKKLELKQNYSNCGIKHKDYTWTPSTVRNILNNEIYIGNTIQGKRRTKSYKIHKVEVVPKDEWIRVENTHEAIIDKETFKKAQELYLKDTKISQKTHLLSKWAGFLKCYDCKMAMNKKSSTNGTGKTYEYYICSTYKKKSKSLCTKHTIKEERLEEAVLKAINFHINRMMDIEEIQKKLKESTFQVVESNYIDNIIADKKSDIAKFSNLKRELYEDWKNENITKDEYIEYKILYGKKIEKMQENLKTLLIAKECEKSKNYYLDELIKKLKTYKKLTVLSRDIMIELVEYIYIKENGDIVIKFNFRNEAKKF